MARPRRIAVDGNSNVGNSPDIAAVGNGGGDTGSSELAAGIVIDPASIPDLDGSGGGSVAGDGSVSGSAPKRRGRKPGSTNRSSAKGAPLDISGLGNIILNFHMLISGITRAEELLLEKEEADKLAEAMGKVARHYNVEVAAKTTDWINLGIVAGGVYVPRFLAIRIRTAANKASNPKPMRANNQQPSSPSEIILGGVYDENGRPLN